MVSELVYLLRRAILTAAKEYSPGPVNLDDIANHPTVRALCPAREELVKAWNDLAVRDYLVDFAGSNGEFRTIGVRGLDQINQEGERTVFIWGRYGRRTEN